MKKSHIFSHILKALMVIVVIALMMIAEMYCFDKIRSNFDSQIEVSMKDVSSQNAIVLNNEINGIHDVLLGMAEEMQILQQIEIEELIAQLSVYNEVYNFVRIGFAYPDGSTYLSDGNTGNFSYEEYFKNSMKGKMDISAVLNDVFLDGAQINIFSVPVYRVDNGPVEGVLFAVCKTEDFTASLSVESFGGLGKSYVVNTDGTIISQTDSNEEIKSIYDLEHADTSNSASKVQEDMLNGREGYILFEGNTKSYIYYMPLSIDIEHHNWYVFTMVPVKVLDDRIDQIMYYVSILLIVFSVTIFAVFVIYFYNYISKRKQLLKLAFEDKLTGGANYSSFIDKVNRIKGREGYIVAMGIEEFHIITNVCGVETGNEVIRMIWKELSEDVKSPEECAHVHSDRFIIFYNEASKGSVIREIGNLTQAIMHIEKELSVPKIMPHFGVCYLNKSDDIESTYERAKQAKYTVKNTYVKNYCFADELDLKKIEEDKIIEDEFQESIENRRFEVWYQPKYNPVDNSIVSAEALVRLRDKEGNLISPGRFIPIFEGNGKISELDEYVFKVVCENQRELKNKGLDIVPVAVNISRASLYYGDIVDRYRVILESYGLQPKDVEIEVTESVAVDNEDVYQLINEFRSVGFTLSLDDFGSGYSSLATLNELHFDILKLDKSLIDYIGETNGEKLLYHIVQLAKGIGLHITAEGVETKEQVDFLVKIKCDDVQGFYFSRPLPYSEFYKLRYDK